MYYVYKDLPVLALHPQAGLAAQAAECAGEQGYYWEMHSQLFAEPTEWSGEAAQARRTFVGYAQEQGLDAARLGQCLDEGRYKAEVEQDVVEAQRLGLTGTPAFIINGKLLSGAQPTELFLRVLDRELAE